MPQSPSPENVTAHAVSRGATALSVEGLTVTVAGGRARAVRDVSFSVARGESVGLVGESGSGKSLTCRSVLGVLPPGCEVAAGSAVLSGTTADGAEGAEGAELTALTRRQWGGVRGSRLGAVFQDPASYLNPTLTVGRQLAEQLRVTLRLSRTAAHARAVALFTDVGLHRPEDVYHQYPHELSGGMLQRVLIAIAISCDPELLIADEATTALDVVVQAEILELLQRLRTEHGLALLLVTHDLAVVAEVCDRVLVMYAGEIVEDGPTAEVLAAPSHRYTEALLRVASLGAWGRRELDVIAGRPPEAGAELPGCRFADRCDYATAACTAAPVPLHSAGNSHRSRCLRVAEAGSGPNATVTTHKEGATV
ncbi:ABC transporter ATP-binding protein [Streptomyces sp. H39-S7]|uniref:ABC transporter ATP-binding protein n=1 Tax=Streptomyces sp. H39-S7 TaxID=3004357 RepID=UPI0022AEDA08|nr:ABC transporter ATP-binding protein [Streptomyces sp. H39-S7]MCZ4123335.1 ABC transporter ATP-binding protein [Streptomyces sp. H39-S7]